MKRDASIFTLLGGAILLGCVVIGSLLVLLHLRQADQLDRNDLENRISFHRTLLQTLFDSHLEQTQLRLEVLNRQLQHTLSLDLPLRELAKQVQNHIGSQGERSFDRLLMSNAEGTECYDFSSPFYATPCANVLDQFDSLLYRWHLYSVKGDNPQAGVINRVPVVAPHSGRVTAYLYAGVVLTDNFSLLNRVLNSTGQQGMSLSLTLDKQLLVSTAGHNDNHRRQISALTNAPHAVIDTPSHLGYAMPIQLSHEPNALSLGIVIDRSTQSALRADYLNHSLSAIAVGTLLALIIGMVAIKLALRPLVELLRYTRSMALSEPPPSLGPVREINQISQIMANYVRELNNSRDKLARYSSALESAHQETQQSNLSLHERTQELEAINQQLEELMTQNKGLLHRIFHLQEEERRQLAEELHDHLGQTLAAVRTEAHLIKRATQAGSGVHQSAEQIINNTQHMYDIVYNRITSLRPMPLNDLGLIDALSHMPAINALRNKGILVVLKLPHMLPRLKGEIEIALFRIAQEALANVDQHANASEVILMLEYQDNCLQLTVRDNGLGFDTQSRPRAGFGINGMRERCSAIGGELLLDSAQPGAGSGTRIIARLPLPPDLFAA